MKILICTGIYPPDSGGPATYSKLIQNELIKRGHKVTVVTYGDDVSGAYFVSRKDSISIRYIKYFLKVLKLGKNVDFIYVMDPVSSGFPATLANIFLNKKLVLKVVGDYAWEQAKQIKNYKLEITNLDSFYPFNNKNSFKIKIFKIIQTWVAIFADKVVTPSFYLKDILVKGWGIDEKKVEVIYNSFVIPQDIVRSVIRDKFKVLSVARLVPWKGLDILIEIVSMIPNIELEIIGDGPQMSNLKAKIKTQNIKLLGRLPQKEVVQKMCSANLFILNSAYEGLSHVILEAMACGLPVAVSSEGGNTELVGENEERGYLFPYNNVEKIKSIINLVFDSVDTAKQKVKNAKVFVNSFKKDKMVDRLELLFKSLYNSSQKSKN